MDTLTTINRLSSERHQLYRLAGHQTLTQSQIDRIHAITGELYQLWDTHRREVASGIRYQPVLQFNSFENRRAA